MSNDEILSGFEALSKAIGGARDWLNEVDRQHKALRDLVYASQLESGGPHEPFWVAWPIESIEPARITSQFNDDRDYGKHEGLDGDGYINLMGRAAAVLAAQDGVIEYVVNRTDAPSYGHHIVIRHPWGDELDRYRTLYGHLASTIVEVGQEIRRGQKIGVAGNSGTKALHLHFNVHDAMRGLKGYVRCRDCSARWPEGVIDPMSVMRMP